MKKKVKYVSISRILHFKYGKGGDYVYDKLENDPDVDVLEYGCLNNCGVCSCGLYALVDGDTVEGDTPDELLKNIYKHIEENDFTNLL